MRAPVALWIALAIAALTPQARVPPRLSLSSATTWNLIEEDAAASARLASCTKLHRHRKGGLREGEHFDELLVAQ